MDKSNSQIVVGSLVHHENLSRSQYHMGRSLTKEEIMQELSKADEFADGTTPKG